MRSGILRTYVATLRLRADAPWPSEMRGRIRRWLAVRPLAGILAGLAGPDRVSQSAKVQVND